MRWLLLKDLQILKRSPLLVALLAIYPVVIALMIGFALSSPPGKPRVAIDNELPQGGAGVTVGGQKVDAARYGHELSKTIEPVKVSSRDEALAKVRSGDAIAAIIIPSDLITQLQAELTQGIGHPRIEVALNVSDPLERQFVDATIKARLQDLQVALSKQILRVATTDLGRVLDGGSIDILGQQVHLLGLRRSRDILAGAQGKLPRGSLQTQVRAVVQFADLAIQGLGFAGPVLGTIGQPLTVERTELSGKTTPADSYAVAIAVTLSLMFVTLGLAAGMLALEREEHAFGRLVRGLVSRTGLLAEKTVLAAGCAVVAALIMSVGIGLFVSLRWGRFPLWVVAIAFAALAFAALGVAIGALAREVRAASLLALLGSLPIAFLALVPPNAVSGTLHDVLSTISGIFPFKPGLQAISAALTGADNPGIGLPLVHLAVLTLVFGALARVAVRRF